MSRTKSYYIVPHKVDLDTLAKNIPGGSKLTRDKLAHLLTILLRVGHKKMDDFIQNGHVHLSSILLQKFVREYNEGFEFLKAQGVVEINKSYCAELGSISGYCKGYRIAHRYVGQVKRGTYSKSYSITVAKGNRRRKKHRIECKHLDNWINSPDFSFNVKDARVINLKLWNSEKKKLLKDAVSSGKTRVFSYKKKKYLAITKYMLRSTGIEAINSKSYALGRDQTSYRYHSPITNLKKELRCCFKYKREDIHQVDIVNSQPYLLQAVLDGKIIRELGKLRSFDKYEYVLEELGERVSNLIMLVKPSEITDNQLFKEYKKKVNEGKLYENFMAKVKTKLGKVISRDEAKIAVLQALYSGNQFIGYRSYKDADSSLKTMFKECYPEVYEIIRLAKSKESSTLARLLQTVESHLIIDNCCERLSKEHPHVPIWTIHDSIATIEEYLPLVGQIMEEEFVKLIGSVPKLKREKW